MKNEKKRRKKGGGEGDEDKLVKVDGESGRKTERKENEREIERERKRHGEKRVEGESDRTEGESGRGARAAQNQAQRRKTQWNCGDGKNQGCPVSGLLGNKTQLHELSKAINPTEWTDSKKLPKLDSPFFGSIAQ